MATERAYHALAIRVGTRGFHNGALINPIGQDCRMNRMVHQAFILPIL